MDNFTQSTLEKVSKALIAAGHKPGRDGREGHSGFKITAAGTPGAIRLSYGTWVNPHYGNASDVRRSRTARQLEHLGRYTLDLLSSFHVHLVSTPRARYLLVSQHTVQEKDQLRCMMVRAALMDLPVGYHAAMEDGDTDTIRVTFTPAEDPEASPEELKKRTTSALREAQALLTEQDWQVVDHMRRGFLFVWESPFADLDSL